MLQKTDRIDLRCPTDYTGRDSMETPTPHQEENTRGYIFTQMQEHSGFFKRIVKRHPDGSRLAVFGGGRTSPPVDPRIEQINIDFDEDGYRPLLVADLNSLPPQLFAQPNENLEAVFERARREISEPARSMIEKLQDILSEKEIGSCLLSMTMNYLRRNIRRQLVGLCIAGLKKDGTIYIGDRHPSAFPGGTGFSLGFQEAKEAAVPWGDTVQLQEYYRAPELPATMRRQIGATNNHYPAMIEIAKGADFVHLPYEPAYDRAPLLAHNDPKKAKKDIGMGLCFGHHVLEITKKA